MTGLVAGFRLSKRPAAAPSPARRISFLTRDHLGSIREMTTGTSATVLARYDYDPYGQQTQVSGTAIADFGYTGFYVHQPSGLDLATYRGYLPPLARWTSRDPLANGMPLLGTNPSRLRARVQIGEQIVGPNLYDYVDDNPINLGDPSGLMAPSCVNLRKIPQRGSNMCQWQCTCANGYQLDSFGNTSFTVENDCDTNPENTFPEKCNQKKSPQCSCKEASAFAALVLIGIALAPETGGCSLALAL
jgi:RHS repeat-associated protein